VLGTHRYERHGQYPVAVSIADDGGAVAAAAIIADIAVAPPRVTSVEFGTAEGEEFTGIVATFADYSDSQPQQFAAEVNWGDSESSPGEVEFDEQGQLVVVGEHIYAHDGMFPVAVAVVNSGNATGSDTVLVKVEDALLFA